jgi:DNA-binding protein HU-beta
MNKQDLIDAMAANADISKNAAEIAFNTVTDSIATTVAKGDKVAILGFGSFEPSKRAARSGRNPQTGQTISIPAQTSVRFKVGKKLKDAVRDSAN